MKPSVHTLSMFNPSVVSLNLFKGKRKIIGGGSLFIPARSALEHVGHGYSSNLVGLLVSLLM